jgi:hypothetical protein
MSLSFINLNDGKNPRYHWKTGEIFFLMSGFLYLKLVVGYFVVPSSTCSSIITGREGSSDAGG